MRYLNLIVEGLDIRAVPEILVILLINRAENNKLVIIFVVRIQNAVNIQMLSL